MIRATVKAATPTRERILDVALTLFSRDGYDGASVRDIARQVGIRESSLYNHFASKAAILAELMKAYGPGSSASRLEAARYRALAHDPLAFCRQYAEDLVSQWSDPREQSFQRLFATECNRDPALRAEYAHHLFSWEQGVATDYFRGFALAGLIALLDARETARIFMAGLIYIRIEHFKFSTAPPQRRQVMEAIDRFLAYFLSLIGAKAAAPSSARPRIRRNRKFPAR
jgi:AcrR family transcriptional regulator